MHHPDDHGAYHGASTRLPPSLQYAILMTMVLTIFIKYVLHSVDLQSENPWDNKAVYMLYTELFTGNRILGQCLS